MNICIPVEDDRGLESTVCAHFGSAPFFMILDSDTRACRAIANGNAHHEHGRCSPLATLAGLSLDAVVVGGIGRGALNALRAGGINVFLAQAGPSRVAEVVDALQAGQLRLVTPDNACAGH